MVDIKDVPRDAALQGLAFAADGEAMRQRLAPHFGDRVQLLQVKVARFTYKPARNARLTYRIKLLDPDRRLKTRHVLHGRMEPPEAARHLYKKASRKRWVQPAYGPPLFWFEDLGLVLWGFPNDPKLPGIETMARPASVLAVVQALRQFDAFRPQACESTVVKYVPAKRLVMRHELRGADGRKMLVFGKTYAHDHGAGIHAVTARIWEAGQGDPDAFASPEPLAWLPEHNTLLLGALPGTAAIAALDREVDLRAPMVQAGRGLARIHKSGVGDLEPWTATHEFENFIKATEMLQRYDPELQASICRLRALGQAAMASIEPVAPVSIHGAFRFTQLLAYRGRLALVDFDGFRSGHPLIDVGSFAAHLLYMEAKGELDERRTREAVRAFADAYAASAPWGAPRRALHWYAAIQLVAKHAQKCVKRLKDDGDAKIRHMLDTSEGLLDGRHVLR
jgi:hypothetical protein